MLGSAPGLGRRAVHIVAAGPRAEGREKIAVAKMGAGGATRNWDRVAASLYMCPLWFVSKVQSRSATVQMAGSDSGVALSNEYRRECRRGQDEALHEKSPGGRPPR